MAKTTKKQEEPEKITDPSLQADMEVINYLKAKGETWTNGNKIENDLLSKCHYTYVRTSLSKFLNLELIDFDRGSFNYKINSKGITHEFNV